MNKDSIKFSIKVGATAALIALALGTLFTFVGLYSYSAAIACAIGTGIGTTAGTLLAIASS